MGAYSIQQFTKIAGELCGDVNCLDAVKWSVVGTGFSVSGGYIVANNVTSASIKDATRNYAFKNHIYSISFVVSDYTSGSVSVQVGNTGTDVGLFTGNGTKTINFTVLSSGLLGGILFVGRTGFTGKITNVHVTDVTNKASGSYYLQCDTAGVIGIPSSAASGKWTVEWLKGAETNLLRFKFISQNLSLSPESSYSYTIVDSEGLSFAKFVSGSGTGLGPTAGSYITNNTLYKTTIYRLGSSAGKFPKYLIPAGTIYPAWTFLITIQGGVYTNETIVSVTSGSTNPVTDSTYQTSKYFCIDADAGDFIGDIKHETSWSV
jgi:hypothetical protein